MNQRFSFLRTPCTSLWASFAALCLAALAIAPAGHAQEEDICNPKTLTFALRGSFSDLPIPEGTGYEGDLGLVLELRQEHLDERREEPNGFYVTWSIPSAPSGKRHPGYGFLEHSNIRSGGFIKEILYEAGLFQDDEGIYLEIPWGWDDGPEGFLRLRVYFQLSPLDAPLDLLSITTLSELRPLFERDIFDPVLLYIEDEALDLRAENLELFEYSKKVLVSGLDEEGDTASLSLRYAVELDPALDVEPVFREADAVNFDFSIGSESIFRSYPGFTVVSGIEGSAELINLNQLDELDGNLEEPDESGTIPLDLIPQIILLQDGPVPLAYFWATLPRSDLQQSSYAYVIGRLPFPTEVDVSDLEGLPELCALLHDSAVLENGENGEGARLSLLTDAGITPLANALNGFEARCNGGESGGPNLSIPMPPSSDSRGLKRVRCGAAKPVDPDASFFWFGIYFAGLE